MAIEREIERYREHLMVNFKIIYILEAMKLSIDKSHLLLHLLKTIKYE